MHGTALVVAQPFDVVRVDVDPQLAPRVLDQERIRFVVEMEVRDLRLAEARRLPGPFEVMPLVRPPECVGGEERLAELEIADESGRPGTLANWNAIFSVRCSSCKVASDSWIASRSQVKPDWVRRATNSSQSSGKRKS